MLKQISPFNAAILFASLFIKSTNAVQCPNARLIKAQGGRDSTCGGGTNHYWPVDYGTDACHAWEGSGTDGRLHTNSAKNMRCEDGKFKFTQYAGNLVCGGSGVDKVIGTDCEQDIPPTIYTIGVDLSCCIDPDGAACQALVGQPSAREGSSIFLDGEECDDSDGGGSGPTTPSTSRPTTPPTPSTPRPSKAPTTPSPTRPPVAKPTRAPTDSTCNDDTCSSIRRRMACNSFDCCTWNRRAGRCMFMDGLFGRK